MEYVIHRQYMNELANMKIDRCPFCGGQAELKEKYPWAHIECLNCGASSRPEKVRTKCKIEEIKQDAIVDRNARVKAAWNHRNYKENSVCHLQIHCLDCVSCGDYYDEESGFWRKRCGVGYVYNDWSGRKNDGKVSEKQLNYWAYVGRD